jgi:hypothetical protein
MISACELPSPDANLLKLILLCVLLKNILQTGLGKYGAAGKDNNFGQKKEQEIYKCRQ